MKHRFYIVSALFLAVALLYGCDEESTGGVSKITYYAEITLTGDQWNSIPQGGTWTEPGVKATEEGAEIEVTTGGDVVNPNVPGVYVIEYTAVNRDGFPATQYRYVGVISPDVAGSDLTGKYKRDAGDQGISTVTKVAGKANLYQTDNIGGVKEPGPATTVNFYHYAPGVLGVPYQLVAGNPFYAQNATVEADGSAYHWVVINPGYGTALRNFNKQK
ncbi:immunoglobulin-like domain-containing protein [Dawidia soli]|uniref:DUF5011 domain-containing protein n=1 Tax=Dawidia soli TaxID=2782352 RepID=A0AAP2D5J3_9BACT|nr:immunoglobulin-like domain-containing protein [Dawidia soli]MBT1685768.1 DUF5011 domain-containing protein [Dawidia soli]